MWDILGSIWVATISIESDLARRYRVEVAFMASMGWISTIHIDGSHYTRAWHITAEGEFALRHHLQGI